MMKQQTGHTAETEGEPKPLKLFEISNGHAAERL
jgi:hypothetical protein